MVEIEQKNSITFDILKDNIQSYSEEERDKIEKAFYYGLKAHEKQFRDSGEPYFIHPIEVSKILIEMNLDANTICAGLLHDVIEDTDSTAEIVEEEFGSTVRLLVEGVTKFRSLSIEHTKEYKKSESVRKMLLAMAKDIRVILIKLADRLHNMRTLRHLDKERQVKIAKETLEIYSPLANRLGMNRFKTELEDLCLRAIDPDEYYELKEFLSQKKVDREQMLKRAMDKIEEQMKLEGIDYKIKSRVKNFYSIYQKKKRLKTEYNNLFDYHGIRIILKEVASCYHTLGIIHKLWTPINGKIKDYIAKPKVNGYQSLHTAVMLENKTLEFQIRTNEMDEVAEYGVAAHWYYKNNITANTIDDVKLKLIDKLNEIESQESDPIGFYEAIKREILKERIYVFTPRKEVIDLPLGATPLDFAYRVHTKVGEICSGAKVDGVIVSLKTPLKNGQTVEILTNKNAHPKREWLKIVKSNKTKQKIRQWLTRNENLDNIQETKKEKEPVEKEKKEKTNQLTENLNEKKLSQLATSNKIGILVGGENNILIRYAKCCNPMPGDKIVGYISRGRGITIHRSDCKNISSIEDFESRGIEADWVIPQNKKLASFSFRSKAVNTIFYEITKIAQKFKSNLVKGDIVFVDKKKNVQSGLFALELANEKDYNIILKNLKEISDIITIEPSQTKG